MTTETVPATEMRASDAERERVVALLQRAGVDGRLTIAEVDERVGAAYAAMYRRELPPLTRDLPVDDDAGTPSGRPAYRPARASRSIAIHAVIAAVLSVIMISRWAASGLDFFWPAFPMFWLWGSLAARVAISRRGGWSGRPGPRWMTR